jgi:hypothetical protein
VLSTYRLVHLIEQDAAEMASGLLDDIERDPRAAGYLDKVPSAELWKRVHEIYRHLGEWLEEPIGGAVERRYREIGGRRAAQGLELSKLLYVILATKRYLHDYVLAHRPKQEQPAEVMADLEMETLLEEFYDQAVVFATVGYEERKAQLCQCVPKG